MYLRFAYVENYHEAAVSWNSAREEYLVVYEVQLGGTTDYDIYAQRVSATGTLTGSAFAVTANASVLDKNPQVAYSPSTDRYAVVTEHGTNGDIALTTFSYDGSTNYGTWRIDNQTSGVGTSRDPKVAYQSNDTFMIVWSDNDASAIPHQWILGERRDSNGNVIGGADDVHVASALSVTGLRRPSVAYNSTSDTFCVAWEHNDGSAQGVTVNGTLTSINPTPTVIASHGREPAIAWSQAQDEFLVAFSDDTLIGSDYNIFMQRLVGSGTSAGQKLGGIRIVDASSTRDQNAPAIAYSAKGEEYLIAYTETVTASNHDIYVQPIRTDGMNRGGRIAVNATYDNSLAPAIAISTATAKFLVAFESVTDTGSILAELLTDTQPRVLWSDPPNNATNIPTDWIASVRFSDPMDRNSVTQTGTCTIWDTSSNMTISATVTYVGNPLGVPAGTLDVTRTAFIVPSSLLSPNRLYRLVVTTTALDTSNNNLDVPWVVTFTTGVGPGLVDTDHDGLLDAEELLLTSNTLTADTDGDGRSDLAEYGRTDMLRRDTDTDGTWDGSDPYPLDPTRGGGDITPPTVVSFSPASAAVDVQSKADIYVQFSEPVTSTSVVNGQSFYVRDLSANMKLDGTIYFQNNNRTIRFHPDADLPYSTSFSIVIAGPPSPVRDLANNPIAATVTSGFTTIAAPYSPTIPQFEALHHPSFGPSSAAGLPSLHFGAGGVPNVEADCPYWNNLAPVRVADVVCCDVCETPPSGTIPVVHTPLLPKPMPRDALFSMAHCTGLSDIFPKNRTHVSLANGAFLHERIDWATSDRSLNALIFSRTYRSNLTDANGQPYFGMLGYRTMFNWETRLSGSYPLSSGSDFTIRAPDGRTCTARWSGGSWTLDSGFYGRVVLDSGAGEMKWIFRNGLTYGYRTSDGRIAYIRDRNGCSQTAQYVSNRLDTIIDATGRQTSFSYDVNGLLASISTFDGLTIGYHCTNDGYLDTVTYPTPGGGAAVRTEQWTYNSSSHLLETIKNGRGEVTLTNHYDLDGLVESQDHINGSIFYIYDFGNASGPLTTVVDRMGNVTKVLHDASGAPLSTTRLSRGVNSLDPTTSWTQTFVHDANGEVTKTALPRGNVVTFKYDTNGHVIEHRRKTADAADNDTNDLVETWTFDPDFGSVLRYMSPRANDPSLSGDQKVALTRFYFYDHEDIDARCAAENAFFGTSAHPVTIVATAEQTFGRTGGGKIPTLDSSVFQDTDGDGLLDRGGNLWVAVGPAPTSIAGSGSSYSFSGSWQVIEGSYSCNQYGQLLIARDASGDLDRFQYYAGVYDSSENPHAGYLKFRVADSSLNGSGLDLTTGDPTGTEGTGGHLALTTTLDFDARGNNTVTRSPRGVGRTDDVFKTTRTYDQNNLLLSKTVSDPFAYQWTYIYDDNMMLSEERVPNVVASDSNGNGIQDGPSEQQTGSPAYFSITFSYCVCNNVVSRTTDASGLALTTTFEFDLNEQLVVERDPLGNATTSLYDERYHLIRRVRGANDSALALTERYVLDANGNTVGAYDDLGGNTPTTSTFDLFDRQTHVTDKLGNDAEAVYDRDGHVIEQIRRDASSAVLAHVLTTYDEAGRAFQVDRAHFDVTSGTTFTQGPLSPPVNHIASGIDAVLSRSLTLFDVDGRATQAIDDNAGMATYVYDRASRVTQTADPMGNITRTYYDADSHPIDVEQVEKSTLDGSTVTFRTGTFFDELGRVRVSMSPMGNATRYLYDSRGNVIQVSDAQADNNGETASGLDYPYNEHQFGDAWSNVSLSGRGNTTRFTFDGAGRQIAVDKDLRSDGTGNGSVVKSIHMGQGFDAASRLTSQTDDNGNTTSYEYDGLGRRILVTNADGSTKYFFFFPGAKKNLVRDERGVETTYLLDALGRTYETCVSFLPPGAGQVSFEKFEYDGLSRMTRAENNHAILVMKYDSLGPVISEDQTINVGADRTDKSQSLTSTVQKVVTSKFDGLGNRTQLDYPGGTTVYETHDANNRLVDVKDGSTTLANYEYIGSGGRVTQKQLPAATTALYVAYDDDRRVTRYDQRRTSDNMRLAGYTYAWDRVGNRWYEKTLVTNTAVDETNGTGEAWTYDSAYRMVMDYTNVPSGSIDAMTNDSPRQGVPSGATAARGYNLDGVGNRIDTFLNGVVDTAYGRFGADNAMNQYTYVNDTPQAYDRAGNLLADGTRQYFYTAKNQLAQVLTATADVRYRFDALGRRVWKAMANGNFLGCNYADAVYAYAGSRIIEEFDGSGLLRKNWTYGSELDEPIRQVAPDYADLNNNGNTGELATVYYLTNYLGSIVALVDSTGAEREGYAYGVHGSLSLVMGKTGASIPFPVVGNPWAFSGRQLEVEERLPLYQFRAREYYPDLGHFLSRDPIAKLSFPNLSEYVNSNPVSSVDPWGLITATKTGHDFLTKGFPNFSIEFTISTGKPSTLFIQSIDVDILRYNIVPFKITGHWKVKGFEYHRSQPNGNIVDRHYDSALPPVNSCEQLVDREEFSIGPGIPTNPFGPASPVTYDFGYLGMPKTTTLAGEEWDASPDPMLVDLNHVWLGGKPAGLKYGNNYTFDGPTGMETLGWTGTMSDDMISQ